MFFKERAAASERFNERLLLKENVQLIFFCVWLLLETFQHFLMNVWLLLKRYAPEIYFLKEKNVRLLLKNYVHLRNYSEVKNRLA